MKLWFKIFLTVFFLASGVLLARTIISMRQPAPYKPEEEVKAVVEVQKVQLENLTLAIPSQGAVEATNETQAAAEVAGKIIRISPSFVAGGNFKKDDVLLEIDPSDYQTAVVQAEVALAEAKLAITLEEARVEQTKRDVSRLNGGEKLSDLALRKPQIEAAQARIRSAEANLTRARRDLDRTRYHAPYNGRIRKKLADLGSYVGPGTPLVQLYATDVYEVRLPLSLADYQFINLADKPEVKFILKTPQAIHQWTGRLVRSEGAVDPASRSIYLIAQISQEEAERNRAHPLLPGLFIEGEIVGREQPQIARISRKAFVSATRVLVVTPDHKLTFRDVEILRSERDNVLVSKGLQTGELVCITALATAIEGMPVEILPPKTAGGDGSQANTRE